MYIVYYTHFVFVLRITMGKCHGSKGNGGSCGRSVKTGYYCWQHKNQETSKTNIQSSVTQPSPSKPELVTCDICFEDDIPKSNMIMCRQCTGGACRSCVVASKSKLCPYCRYKKFFSTRSLSTKEKKEWKRPFAQTVAEREFVEEHTTLVESRSGSSSGTSEIELVLQELHSHTGGNISDDMLATSTLLVEVAETMNAPPSIISRSIHEIACEGNPRKRIAILLSLAAMFAIPR